MKKIIIRISLAAASIFSICSCADFLNTKPYDFVAPETFYTTESNCKMALAGVYSALNQVGTYGNMYSILISGSDDMAFYTRKATTTAANVYGNDHTPANSNVWEAWTEFYTGINNANMALAEAMMLPDGQYITDLLTDEQLTRLNGYMRETLGMDFNNPMCKNLMGRYRPSALAMSIEMAVYMKMTPGLNPTKLIDSYFQEEALKQGKRVLGLESVEFQVKTLFAESSIEEEIEDLMKVVDNPEASHEAMKALAEAYFAQDIKAITKCVTADMDCPLEESEEWARVCTNRNRNWVAQMPQIMSEGSTLFVVGAAHLIGEDGVVALLKKEGYKVKAVK